MIRGLTLWRPWAASIVAGPKRVENRPWHPPIGYIQRGLWIAIHAGKRWDPDGAAFLRPLWPASKHVTAPLQYGPAVELGWAPWYREQGIVGVARVTAAVRVEDMAEGQRDPFAFGPWCWLLDDVKALPEAIPCRGAQGLWTLEPEHEAAIAAIGGVP